MIEERVLKEKGEELAKIAVKSQLGAKQLRTVYTLTKTKPLPLVEAYVKRQMARVSGTEAFETILDLLAAYDENKASFLRVLMYANMLYDYYKKKSLMQFYAVIEESAKKICEQKGCRYLGIDLSAQRDRLESRVNVSGYQGEYKQLAFSIQREILRNSPNFHGKIWINPIDRR